MALRHGSVGSVILALTVAGCSSQPSQLALPRQEVREAKKAAISCDVDTSFAPVEHSENCLITVRLLWSDRFSKSCPNRNGLHCRDIARALKEIDGVYSHAVARSLWSFGKPKEFDQTGPRILGFSQFFDPQLMERAFKNCLADEAASKKGASFNNPIEKEGKVWPAMIVMNPLMPGQKCIRAGSAVVATQRQT